MKKTALFVLIAVVALTAVTAFWVSSKKASSEMPLVDDAPQIAGNNDAYGGGIAPYLRYRLEYGAIPDSVIAYAKEVNDPKTVQSYLDQMYKSYSDRYAKGDLGIDNELYAFMEQFKLPAEEVAKRLDNVYTKEEFKIICANDQKQINKAFVNTGFLYCSEDGTLYPLNEICAMSLEEINRAKIPSEAIMKLIEGNKYGVTDFNTGKPIVTREELEVLQERISVD